MYSSGSAMLPSTEAIASLRQTRRLRRQTGIQRSDSSGARISEAEIIGSSAGWAPSSIARAVAPSGRAAARRANRGASATALVAQLASGELDEKILQVR